MDPITHGLIGLAISTFSGQAVSLDNPIAVGCAIGAMSPDVDSVVRLFKDDAYYLKHHRGKSHAIPMLAVFSVAITLGLSFVYTDMAVLQVLIWTFIGALSHTLFDILNSYGAMLLRKKKKMNLLTLYDPVITSLVIWLIVIRDVDVYFNVGLLIIFTFYLMFRSSMKKKASYYLFDSYQPYEHVNDITVLPALMAFYKWDFIINTEKYAYVGNFNSITKKIKIIERLDAQCKDKRAIFDDTALGAYFNDFSPNLHVVHSEDDQKMILRVLDLRYYVNNSFLHNATLEVCKKSNQIIKSELHPYKVKKRVVFDEAI